METPHPLQTPSFGKTPFGWLRESLTEAARFWEPRRLIYNAVLLAIVAAWVATSWPHFRPALTLESLGIMTVLALLANVCYCAAYLVDIGAQTAEKETPGGTGLEKLRWGLWVLGTLLAVLFENYWIADEIYPYVK